MFLLVLKKRIYIQKKHKDIAMEDGFSFYLLQYTFLYSMGKRIKTNKPNKRGLIPLLSLNNTKITLILKKEKKNKIH